MALSCELAASVSSGRVRFTLTVANEGLDPLEITFRDAGRVDVAVTDGPETVWRWREGRMLAQVVESVTLAPGERFSVDRAWVDPTPGSYEAIASLVADPSCRAGTTVAVP